MRPLRVLYLVGDPGIPLAGPGGAAAHVRGICRGLAELGHRVELLGLRDVDARGWLEDPGIPWETVGPPPGRGARWERTAARGLAHRALERARSGPPVDLLWERYSLFSDAGLRAARALGVPLLLEVNAPLRLERQRFGPPPPPLRSRYWERRVLRGADRLLAVSRYLRDWLVHGLDVEPWRVRFLPNGSSAVGPASREEARRALGVGPDELLLGFIGSFRPWHGAELLGPLLRSLPGSRLLAVGEDARGRLPPGLDQPDLRERVLRAGQVPARRLPGLVAAMDVGLAPYPPDAPPWFSPLKLLDYRAQGTPAVASALGDCGLLLEGCGELVPPGELPALLAAVRRQAGRRCPPRPRPWSQVAREALEHALAPPPPRPARW